MDRSRSTYGTKAKPTCDTDLGTLKWEKRGRPRERRTVERERAELKLTSWATAAAVAKHRDKWRQLISGPIPPLGEMN